VLTLQRGGTTAFGRREGRARKRHFDRHCCCVGGVRGAARRTAIVNARARKTGISKTGVAFRVESQPRGLATLEYYTTSLV